MRHRSYLTVWMALVLGAALVGCTTSRVFAQPNDSAVSHVPGEVIIKVTEAADQAIKTATRAQHPPVTGLDSLDALLMKYGADSLEPLFPHSPTPELSRFYKLHIRHEASVADAVAELSQDPHIESAQANASMTAYPDQGEMP